jgi:hypothetical protein
MTRFSRGDVVLVKFVFADEKGATQRPGLIVSTDSTIRVGGRRSSRLSPATSVGSWRETTKSRRGANPAFCTHPSSLASSEPSNTT